MSCLLDSHFGMWSRPFAADLVRRRGWILIARRGMLITSAIHLGAVTASVGRAGDCALRLNDPAVSRKHCQFKACGELVAVDDLGSTNGIYLDGLRIDTALLGNGDEVVLASFTLQVMKTPIREPA
jgi:pSer/pThr/pTyr-binding forkhead associated (FHA) protein